MRNQSMEACRRRDGSHSEAVGEYPIQVRTPAIVVLPPLFRIAYSLQSLGGGGSNRLPIAHQ